MEWLVLIAFVGVAALLIGFPWRGGTTPTRDEAELNGLWQERERLLEELRDLDNDAATGRLSAADRQAGRRAVAPQLREVTEALRSRGIELTAAPSGPASDRRVDA